MRKILFIATTILLTQFATGQNLVVKQKGNSETITISLATNPKITFGGNEVTIKNESSTIILSIENILDFSFDNSSTIISSPMVVPQFADGRINLNGLKGTTSITVADLEGRVVTRILPNKEGVATINLDQLPKGIVLISVDNTRIKVLNK